MEFELAFYDSAAHRFNHYTTRTQTVSLFFSFPVSQFYTTSHELEKIIIIHELGTVGREKIK